jgi:hypothetical protein
MTGLLVFCGAVLLIAGLIGVGLVVGVNRESTAPRQSTSELSVAQAAEQSETESGRVEYRWLNVTGMEDA